MKAVRFDKYGGIEVLQVANVPMPEPVLAELAALIASGDLEVPIAATFPLDQVQAAFSSSTVDSRVVPKSR